MKIALFGATGMIGSRILTEAQRRGHEVIAIVRRPETVPQGPGIGAVVGDATSAAGTDIAINAYSPQAGPQGDLSKNAHALLAGLPRAGVSRVIVVGGAGSLEIAPGRLLADSPDFPPQYKARADAQKQQLDVFRAYTGGAVDWTFVSPPMMIAPGERTGAYRSGGDQLLFDAAGTSAISAEDFAIAIVDEAESPAHRNARFSVAR